MCPRNPGRYWNWRNSRVTGTERVQGDTGIEQTGAILTVGSVSLSSDYVVRRCPIHDPVSEIISFDLPDVGAVNESYCIQCVRDLMRRHLTPIDAIGPMRSRYDLLKRLKNEL